MDNLFTPAMEDKLRGFLQPGTLLAFDFDGTLAPIVPKPDKAALGKSTHKLLAQLCDLAPVAVLSGRSAKDVASRVPLPLVACIGNHGMEGVKAHRHLAKEAAQSVKAWKKELAKRLSAEKGAVLEDKKYSLTVHFRASRDRQAAEQRILAACSGLSPEARILPGKCVVNLIIPKHPHKGIALKELMRVAGFERAIFAGDDDTDEDVFRMRDPRILSIRVGKKRGSLAQAYVESQAEMRRVLKMILAAYAA